MEFVTETVRPPTRRARDGAVAGVSDVRADLIDLEDLKALAAGVLDAILHRTADLCMERFSQPQAPRTLRRYPKPRENGSQPFLEMGGWHLEGVLTKVKRGQWQNMVADTVAEHIVRVQQVEANGDWRLEFVQPVILQIPEELPVSGAAKDGTEVFDPASATPLKSYKTTQTLVLRTVLVDMNGGDWTVRRDGIEVQGVSERDSNQNTAMLADALREVLGVKPAATEEAEPPPAKAETAPTVATEVSVARVPTPPESGMRLPPGKR